MERNEEAEADGKERESRSYHSRLPSSTLISSLGVLGRWRWLQEGMAMWLRRR